NAQVVEARADDLQADGQTVGGKSAGQAGGRIPGHVEGVGELGPAYPVPVVLWPVIGHQFLGRKGGDRDGGGQQEVPALEPPVDVSDVGHLALAGELVFGDGDVGRGLDARDQTGVHL